MIVAWPPSSRRERSQVRERERERKKEKPSEGEKERKRQAKGGGWVAARARPELCRELQRLGAGRVDRRREREERERVPELGHVAATCWPF